MALVSPLFAMRLAKFNLQDMQILKPGTTLAHWYYVNLEHYHKSEPEAYWEYAAWTQKNVLSSKSKNRAKSERKARALILEFKRKNSSMESGNTQQ